MVGTDHNRCNCTSTAEAYDNTYTGTADSTTSCFCGNNIRYGRIYITDNRSPSDIEEVEIKKMPPKWTLIRTVFYIILILRHYVEAVARAPPILIDKQALI